MSRVFALIGVGFLSLRLAVNAGPPSADAKKQPAQLTRLIDLGDRRFEYTDLKVALQILRNKYKCDVTLDEAAFEKQGIKAVGDKTINLPKLGIAPAGLILEMIALQAGGTVHVEDGRIKLVPGKARDLKWLVAAPTPKLAAELLKFATLEKPVEGVPLKDVLEFFSDKYGLNIVVFGKDAGDSLCTLPAGSLALGQWTDQFARFANGAVILSGDGLILIVPRKKEK